MSAMALVPRETLPADVGTVILELPIDQVDIGPNVRVSVEAIDELAASIAAHGVLQPIKVRPEGGRWVVVWGQRRLLASRQAGLERIPAIVADHADPADQIAIEQLVENLHRADLPPLDRARAMRLVVDAGTSQADLARELGLHPSTIANDLGLLEAPAAIQASIEKGDLTPAHAKAFKGLAPKTQLEIAKQVIRDGTSAHATEELVQRHKSNEEWQRNRQLEQEASNAKAAERLTEQLGNLAKKKVQPDARIVVTSWQGSGHSALVKRIQALGYTNVAEGSSRAVESRARAVGCDCKVWRVEPEYNRLVITPACVNEKHQRAKDAVDEQKRRDKNALETSIHEQLAKLGPGLVNVWNGFEEPRFLAERRTAQMLLWHALDYNLADWAEKRGGKRGNPWPTVQALTDDELATELGKAIAKAFRDRYGYHVPWGDLAVELGLVATPA
jgi:ParB family chromosome partitioning protein